MSSHHVVKENQEPALVIADAQAIPFEVVEQLLEWSPTIIVLEQALEKCLMWGIKFDVLICSAEKVKSYSYTLAGYAPLHILSCQPDEKPADAAIMFLSAAKHQAVNFLGVPPEEISFPLGGLNVVTLYAGMRWSLICTGRFQKWLRKNDRLRFHSVSNLEKTGLNSDEVVLEHGLVTITGKSPFWVGECLP